MDLTAGTSIAAGGRNKSPPLSRERIANFYDDSSSLSSSSSESDSDSNSGAPDRARPRRGRRRSSCASSLASTLTSSSSLSEGGPRSGHQHAAPSFISESCSCSSTIERSAHTATTPDGWRLYLHRVASTACCRTPRRTFPVILCPGLASGGIESYDLDPRVSMAAHLAERGFDVWVPDLRGNGRSDRPSWWDRKTWWTVDDHLALDIPTVINKVLSATGASQVHWVGHSMGGMLAVGALSRSMECASALRSITLLSSGCFGTGSWHSLVAPLLTRITVAGFHAGHMVPFLAGLKGMMWPVAWAVQSLFYVHANIEPDIAKKLLGSFLSFIPSGVVAQFMGSLNSPLGISSTDGSWNYADPKALAHARTPIFGINGDRDLFCPAAGGLKTVNLFGSPHRRFLFLGPSYGTAQHHYGHFCTLVGKHVNSEVFPHIEAFISEFDTPDTGMLQGQPGPPLPVPAAVVPVAGR